MSEIYLYSYVKQEQEEPYTFEDSLSFDGSLKRERPYCFLRELAPKFIFVKVPWLAFPSFRCAQRVPRSRDFKHTQRAARSVERLPKTRDSVSSLDKRTRRTSGFRIRLFCPDYIYTIYTRSRVPFFRRRRKASRSYSPEIISEIEAASVASKGSPPVMKTNSCLCATRK